MEGFVYLAVSNHMVVTATFMDTDHWTGAAANSADENDT